VVDRFIVCVGVEAKEIPVITSIATRSSKFFQAAMEHDWKEAHEKRILLPETRVDIFEGYLQWLYTGQITFTRSNAFVESIHFYVLGDFLDDFKFRNASLESIMAEAVENERIPGLLSVELAWTRTPADSLLRHLIMEMWIVWRVSNTLEVLLNPTCEAHQFPKEFVLQYFERFMALHALESKQGAKKSYKQVAEEVRTKMYGDAET